VRSIIKMTVRRKDYSFSETIGVGDVLRNNRFIDGKSIY
jgi:hypothetical protein